jgi:hypothetical protein
MLDHQEPGGGVSRDRMTLFAGASSRAFNERSVVEIGVTIAAGGEMKFLSHIALSVALIARDRYVLSFEGIARLSMVKLGIAGEMPTGGAMTVLAIVPQFSLVDIRMTTCAILVQDSRHLQIALAPVRSTVGQGWVALGAQNVNMLSGQRVFGLRMVKAGCGLPAGRSVAITADR